MNSVRTMCRWWDYWLVGKNDEIVLTMRRFVLKTRNFVFKMMNFAGSPLMMGGAIPIEES